MDCTATSDRWSTELEQSLKYGIYSTQVKLAQGLALLRSKLNPHALTQGLITSR